jgi:ribonucleoside-diphosphate reductase beta chain
MWVFGQPVDVRENQTFSGDDKGPRIGESAVSVQPAFTMPVLGGSAMLDAIGRSPAAPTTPHRDPPKPDAPIATHSQSPTASSERTTSATWSKTAPPAAAPCLTSASTVTSASTAASALAVDTKVESGSTIPARTIGDEKVLSASAAALKTITTESSAVQQRKDEELLREGENRWVLFPIRHEDLYKLYKKALAAFWTVEEVDLASDMKDWMGLTSQEQYFIKHVLAFFASADMIVMSNLSERFMSDVQIPEAKCFYAVQLQQEAVHSEMYSLLLLEYVNDPEEQQSLFDAIKTMPAVKAKADWALKWMASGRPFAERLLAFVGVEGLLFSSSFCSIYWLRKRGLMPGLTFSNDKIAADEQLHCTFAITLFDKLENKPSQQVVHEIIGSAVDAERQFVSEALPTELIGINSRTMTEYVEFVADFILQSLGYEKLFRSNNPFPWMDAISLPGKTNFFEKRVGDYQKANVTTTRNPKLLAQSARQATRPALVSASGAHALAPPDSATASANHENPVKPTNVTAATNPGTLPKPNANPATPFVADLDC